MKGRPAGRPQFANLSGRASTEVGVKLVCMSLAKLSNSTQNYLKIIWGITEHGTEPASTSVIAARAGLRPSSVSDAVKRLAAAGLVEHQRYGTIELTEQGREYAVSMVRRHRLVETFLVKTLGYTWDQVHDEAEVLEHAVSDLMIERIDALLGHPTRDPHGDPIPSPTGEVESIAPHTLLDCSPKDRVLVERISDDDPQLLRFFAGHDIAPGTRLEVTAVNSAEAGQGSAVNLVLPNDSELSLDAGAAAAVYVSYL